jgi:hypothetical protein
LLRAFALRFQRHGTHGRNLFTRTPCFGQTSLAVWRLEKGFPRKGFLTPQSMLAADAGDIGLSKGPPMQSTPTLKDTDPHDVFAIESLLAAHAEKAPPLAHEPAAFPVAPQVQVAANPQVQVAAKPQVQGAGQPQVQVAPPISVAAPNPQVEPAFPDASDIPLENIRPGEINMSGLRLPGEQPTAKWVKRVVMALLGLCGALAAAAWQHYGEQATAMAAEWTPPFVLAALPSAAKPAIAEQPSAPTVETAASNQAAVQPPAAVAAAPTQPEPATATAVAAAPAADVNAVAIDGAGSHHDGSAGRGTQDHHRAAQGEPGPNDA